MDEARMYELAEEFLAAWNSQDVGRVVAVYTDDAAYVDPNTRGAVKGAEALRRYLSKLFATWKMHWTLREAYLLDGRNGCAVLWHATFQKTEGGTTVEADGMDLVVVRDDRIERNEVYFDRAVLAPLMGVGAS
ncbi:MAG: nuclear transport factor 2 family protein [Candidatus Hydrogenedentota bacterium]|nr:MAG: nuclear transport factor 2 family protein [Candidatus Hydrogenedentota bacterium]